ncbi:hypothetical protein [Microbacterium sp. KR10-403]|uniref:hypothetical protein n=1 Tax=Microbacterium sp. KR10-403 TaxID=3158581 RepID=UPI0032E4C957
MSSKNKTNNNNKRRTLLWVVSFAATNVAALLTDDESERDALLPTMTEVTHIAYQVIKRHRTTMVRVNAMELLEEALLVELRDLEGNDSLIRVPFAEIPLTKARLERCADFPMEALMNLCDLTDMVALFAYNLLTIDHYNLAA